MKTKYGAKIKTAIGLVAIFGLQAFAAPGTPMDTWKSMISDGELQEAGRNHTKSIQSYEQAATFAQQNRLPARCFEMALCRQTAVEVLANLIPRANAHCDKLMALIAQEKANKTLDADLEVWVLNLANAYQAHTDPQTREQCLLKLSQINKVLYGDKNREYKMGQELLGNYYQKNQTDQTSQLKAAQIQITKDEDRLKQAEQASDPFSKGYFLNDLASLYRTTGQLDRAKSADLELIKMAKTNPQIADGLVGYYASLGSIEFAQGNVSQGKTYFDLAAKQGLKIKGNKQKVAIASVALDGLTKSAKSNKSDASTLLKELLSVQEAVSADPRGQYTLHRMLSEVLQEEHKYDESDTHLERAIEIAQLPASLVEKDISGLYMKLALNRASRPGQMDKANAAFAKALECEKDKTGYQAALINLYWGAKARENGQFALATDKLNVALKDAQALGPEKRGTILADALIIVSAVQKHDGKDKEVPITVQKSTDEIQLQKRLGTKLGPDWFHRL